MAISPLQMLHLDDPQRLEFEARVMRTLVLSEGRTGVVLDQTYFYPTGGGQEHDTGTLDGAAVVDVYKDEVEGGVVHVLAGELTPGEASPGDASPGEPGISRTVTGRIDASRRLRHMQHHTAQHLLSQCFLRLLGLESISANINGDSPSTVDIQLPLDSAQAELTRADLDRVEDLANQVIYEDRLVKRYTVTPEQLQALPLRRPPKVSEAIRIVEIDGLDYTPCGGTHCASTGMIGVVKLLKAERQNEKGGQAQIKTIRSARIVFIAGLQALAYFRAYQEIVLSLANQMSTHPQDVLNGYKRQVEQLKEAQRGLQGLRQEKLVFEAQRLAEHGEIYHSPAESRSYRLALAVFEQRPVSELRVMADELKRLGDVCSVLATYDGQKLSLLTVCPQGSPLAARDLLTRLLKSVGGRGGGDARLAQGGGTAQRGQVDELIGQAQAIMRQL